MSITCSIRPFLVDEWLFHEYLITCIWLVSIVRDYELGKGLLDLIARYI